MTTNSSIEKAVDDGGSSGGFPVDNGEGVVHGHIHNYDNMTYIHGHVHHGHHKDNSGLNSLIEAQDDWVPSSSLNTMSNEDLCRKYVDCQHFEFVNYHTSKQLSETINNNNLDVDNGVGGRFSDRENALNTAIDSTANQDISTIGNGSHHYLNGEVSSKGVDQMLMPVSKKRTFSDVINNVTEDVGSECECNPKILEVCCDMDHAPSSVPTEEGLLEPLPPATDEDLIVCTGGTNNFLVPPAANEKILKKESPDIDCDLTCVCPQEFSSNQDDEAEEEEEEDEDEEDEEEDEDEEGDEGKETEDDIFERFCKECVNLNQQSAQENHCQHQHQHQHNFLQYPHEFNDKSGYHYLNTPSSPASSSLNEGLQKGNPTTDFGQRPQPLGDHSTLCHDHVVNSHMDLKILNDLCDISSLYEFPFANHMNHHKHSHNHVPGHSNQGVNLLHSTIEGNGSRGGSNTHHHHHRIQFHQHESQHESQHEPQHVPQHGPQHEPQPQHLASEEVNPRTAFSWNQNENVPPNLKVEEDQASLLHHHHHHHHQTPRLNHDNLETDTNTINFNWSFKNEDSGQLKCEWDQCFEQFPSLIDLQKHMFRDHVPQEEVTSNLLCNWNDCQFKGDDICSLVNHINSDHGINFGMKVLDNASLLEQREQHHLLHCPEHVEESLNLPCKFTKLQCQWDGCDQCFSGAEDLSNHLEKFHLPRGKSEYHCHWKGCCRKFTQRQKMVRHLKVHSGYKPFKCQVCLKSFSSEDTLNQHMRTHSGEKPFKCHLCGKSFSVSSSLKIHIRTHTGEKPLQCKICGKRFNESSNLNKHLKTHRKKYKCSCCFRSFDTEEKFKAHEFTCCNAPPRLTQI
ncbi:ZYRO0G20526p [Zygosaccharomyces rouxii]|uniref:ZYRO0G20526p n=1 Tax=Zygosaccharomyces rouxii (strain ATCC 2623 / CBS 732 / NBRC 1130 / NCYC 568 / NRRL Y-229) TaxID=559307 RepID=C5E1F3_ZYGRC|nr:uncharacterized protein ZYRO0G20526g [Zygosaccharomyces rouxii]KAH9202928.1 hypothetical protein LQ764DRAFT_228605 [Zygosaccharomyces rouxii]CAR29937.1 ZYRO0G20526p [Zygosaccharomyces rouxii]